MIDLLFELFIKFVCLLVKLWTRLMVVVVYIKGLMLEVFGRVRK